MMSFLEGENLFSPLFRGRLAKQQLAASSFRFFTSKWLHYYDVLMMVVSTSYGRKTGGKLRNQRKSMENYSSFCRRGAGVLV
jgi:hypothetical protein